MFVLLARHKFPSFHSDCRRGRPGFFFYRSTRTPSHPSPILSNIRACVRRHRRNMCSRSRRIAFSYRKKGESKRTSRGVASSTCLPATISLSSPASFCFNSKFPRETAGRGGPEKAHFSNPACPSCSAATCTKYFLVHAPGL